MPKCVQPIFYTFYTKVSEKVDNEMLQEAYTIQDYKAVQCIHIVHCSSWLPCKVCGHSKREVVAIQLGCRPSGERGKQRSGHHAFYASLVLKSNEPYVTGQPGGTIPAQRRGSHSPWTVGGPWAVGRRLPYSTDSYFHILIFVFVS